MKTLIRDYPCKDMKSEWILETFITLSTVSFSVTLLLVFLLRRLRINFGSSMIFFTENANRSMIKFWKMSFP